MGAPHVAAEIGGDSGASEHRQLWRQIFARVTCL